MYRLRDFLQNKRKKVERKKTNIFINLLISETFTDSHTGTNIYNRKLLETPLFTQKNSQNSTSDSDFHNPACNGADLGQTTQSYLIFTTNYLALIEKLPDCCRKDLTFRQCFIFQKLIFRKWFGRFSKNLVVEINFCLREK